MRLLAAPELDLLLASAQAFLGYAPENETLSIREPGIDWARLGEAASREGLSGILALHLDCLARRHRLDLPLEAVRHSLRATFAANGGLFAELLGLRAALQKQGVRVILLKGGALATTAYGGQLGLRPLSDLDILVKDSDLTFIRQALAERGFRCLSPSGTLFTKGSVMFDIHTDLVNASRIRTRALAFRFDPDAIWTKAIALDPGEPSFLMLSPAHQFLHIAVHAQKHSFSRLIWFLDLALVSRLLDWEELLLQAENTGTLRTVAYAVEGMTRLLGVKIPPGLWVSLPPMNRIERRFMDAVVERRASDPAGELVVVFSIPSLLGRLGYLYEFAFPRRKVLSEIFPESSAGWFYFRRAGQMAALALKYLGGALRWQDPVEMSKGDSTSRSAVGTGG